MTGWDGARWDGTYKEPTEWRNADGTLGGKCTPEQAEAKNADNMRRYKEAAAKVNPQFVVGVNWYGLDYVMSSNPRETAEILRGGGLVMNEWIRNSATKQEPLHLWADYARYLAEDVERAKRMAEFGQDVVILLDSLTRLGRAYNRYIETSGRTMTGGVDIRALEIPKRQFGAARKVENGGSLTILATSLIETGSRMDDLIFEEFKGTGNMELQLDRKLAEKRIYPAISIPQSGTRKEELLVEAWKLPKLHMLRRFLSGLNVDDELPTLLKALSRTKSNDEFLRSFDTRD